MSRALAVQLNFLLGCSDNDLASFELARLSEVANLRADLHAILDKLIDVTSQAALAAWFRQTDRETLKKAIQSSPEERTAEILARAKKQIRDGQRSEAELIPRTLLAPGAAHIAASLRYQERNVAKGLCSVCPSQLDRNSVRYCTEHLQQQRDRQRDKAKKLNKPPRGHAAGSLAALAAARAGRVESADSSETGR